MPEIGSWEQLYETYSNMLPEEKGQFLQAVAQSLSADMLFRIAASMRPIEGRRYIDLVFSDLWRWFSPLYAREAIRIVRANRWHTDQEMEAELTRRVETRTELANVHMRELVKTQFKIERDRKPAKTERDADIYRLRTEDPKKWSWERLGKRFQITADAARKAFKRFKKRID
jgi:hypothetical protein